MSKLKPIFSEKSMDLAKNGFYSFWVNPSLTKSQIKSLVAKSFGVHPVAITTINYKKSKRRNMYGKMIMDKAAKKAIVSLQEKEKIGVFEVSGKEAK